MSSSETEPQTEPKPLPDRARDWLFRLIYAWRVGGEEPQRVGSDVTERFVLSDAEWDELATISPYLPDPRAGREQASRWELVRGPVIQALTGIAGASDDIDAAIQTASPRWRLDRMPVVDRALLTLGAYELLVVGARPARRVINRTVELAKRYGAGESRRFVNGILDQIRKNHDIPSG